MKVLFDTNVVLDVLLEREPHHAPAAKLMSRVDRGNLEGILCATSVTTIHYLATKARSAQKAKKHIRDLIAMFEIAPVDRSVLERALDLEFSDYEDAVLHEAACVAGSDGIVTRNGKDFAKARLPIFDPRELLLSLRLMGSEDDPDSEA